MTRVFQATTWCPNCQTWHTAETAFSQWIRTNPALDSGKGYCVVDQDMWVHRYKTERGRDFQLIMCVETKTNGADLTPAQRDTLLIVNQLMRNRRQTPTKQLKHQSGHGIAKAYSAIMNREVVVKAFGMHVLRFSGMGPQDSREMWWDRRQIDAELLTKILSFDLDPDTLQPMDFRSHHARADIPLLEVGG